MFNSALVAVVEHLDDAEWLAATLKDVGARHAAYGVTPPMYGWGEACLLEALAEVSGPDWTPALAAAWGEAFQEIAALMLAGMVDPPRLPS